MNSKDYVRKLLEEIKRKKGQRPMSPMEIKLWGLGQNIHHPCDGKERIIITPDIFNCIGNPPEDGYQINPSGTSVTVVTRIAEEGKYNGSYSSSYFKFPDSFHFIDYHAREIYKKAKNIAKPHPDAIGFCFLPPHEKTQKTR